MFAMIDLLWIALSAGGAGWVVWNYKDKLILWYKGADQFVKDLEAKIASIKAAIK